MRLGILDEAGQYIFDVTSVLEDHRIPVDIPRVIAEFDRLSDKLIKNKRVAARFKASDVKLLPPVPNPSKILCALANYVKHAEEFGRLPPPKPEIFLKAPSSIIGPGDTVLLPPVEASQFHHEAELAVIIGKKAKNVRPEEAMGVVFGYTCFIDVSARGLDDREITSMFRMKSYDTFAPLGPYIVTKDEIPDPHNLDIKLWVNDELRQSANTRDMIHKIPALINYTSSVTTLYPGDIIATGTPEGVGPLKPGDTVKIRIENVGEMTVNVAASKS